MQFLDLRFNRTVQHCSVNLLISILKFYTGGYAEIVLLESTQVITVSPGPDEVKSLEFRNSPNVHTDIAVQNDGFKLPFLQKLQTHPHVNKTEKTLSNVEI